MYVYHISRSLSLLFFFFNDTATTEIYTLSLHDALPICGGNFMCSSSRASTMIWETARLRNHLWFEGTRYQGADGVLQRERSEEHTSELQSLAYLVCRLLLEKKKDKNLSHRS